MIIIFAGIGTVFFIVTTVAVDNMVRCKLPLSASFDIVLMTFSPDVMATLAFGIIWGCSPLVKTWATQVIPYPAEKRAIAIALINSIGNASSIYGSWLWPDKDSPRYTMGFS